MQELHHYFFVLQVSAMARLEEVSVKKRQSDRRPCRLALVRVCRITAL